MSSQSSEGGPAIHHPRPNYYPYTFQHDPPPLHSNSRRRRRDDDDPYQPYLPLPHAHPYGATAVVTGTVPCHVPRNPLVLSHLQECLFPPFPQPHPAAGPPPTKRVRRAPDTRWDPPPPTLQPALVPVAPERPRDVGASAGALLSRDEIERRSPSRRDGIDSALEARLRASYCAYLRCLGIRLGLPQTTIATAVVFCHRFFFHRSHAYHDRFLVATTALFLAAKSEETTCRLLNTVLRASCEISQNQEFNLLPYMLRGQDWFEQYRESVIQTEQMILTTLDFELEVAHPYAALSSALGKLGLSHTVLFNVAWNLINEGKDGQQTQEELQKRDFREELEERERKHYSSKDKSYAEERDRRKSSSQLLLEGSKREAEDKIVPREIDADDSDVEPKSDDESDEDDDDDDDTEALMAELERIKKERAEEKLRKERQQAEEEAKMKEAELMRGNPLININNPGSFSVKRRWDDDVVFKNQARGETKTPKRFINDTIRSDFHRKFLQRYMK